MITAATASLLLWGIPMLVTIAVWVHVNAKPIPPSRGDYDFSGPFVFFARMIFCVVATLLIWLVTFVVAYITA